MKSKRFKYRFKTKKEFIRIIGSNWRNNIRQGWDSDMDYLFNKPYPYHIKTTDTIEHYSYDYDGWGISWDMLIESSPIYTPRKILNKIR